MSETMKERERHPPRGNKPAQGQKRALKTFWHYPFANLVKKRKPPGWEVTVEKSSHSRRDRPISCSFAATPPNDGTTRPRSCAASGPT